MENTQDNIPDNILDLLKAYQKDILQQQDGQYHDLFDQENPLDQLPVADKDNRHEIYIKVTYSTLTIDDKKNEAGFVNVIDDNYVIPVPSSIDYKIFIDKFKTALNNALVEISKE